MASAGFSRSDGVPVDYFRGRWSRRSVCVSECEQRMIKLLVREISATLFDYVFIAKAVFTMNVHSFYCMLFICTSTAIADIWDTEVTIT